MASVKAKLGCELMNFVRLLYESQTACDVILTSKEKSTFYAHQLVLSAFSGFFHSLLLKPSNSPPKLSLPDVRASDLELLLGFLYTGKLNLTKENATDLLFSAVRLDIQAAITLIEKTYKKNRRLFSSNEEFKAILLLNKDQDIKPVIQDTDVSNHEGPETSGIEPVENDESTIECVDPISSLWMESLEIKTNGGEKNQILVETGVEVDSIKVKKKSPIRKKRKAVRNCCTSCPLIFVHKAALKLHSSRIHMEKKQGSSVSNYFDHARTAAVQKLIKRVKSWNLIEKGKVYECAKCGHHTNKICDLRRHVKTHLRDIKCSACDEKFKSCHALKRHIKKMHAKNLKLSSVKHCNLCGKSFKSDQLYDRHLQKHCAQQQSLKCRHCGLTFKYMAALQRHLGYHGLSDQEIGMEFKHPDLVPNVGRVYSKTCTAKERRARSIKCQSCPRFFSSINTLNMHCKQKHGQALVAPSDMKKDKKAKWDCVGCESVFKSLADLTNHMRDAHPDIMFYCSLCKYHTPVKAMFAKHMEMRHESTGKGKPCSECHMKFMTNHNLRIHLYTKHRIRHPKLKIYECPVEGCKFVGYQRYLMDYHKRKHEDTKSFQCEHCQQKFKYTQSLKSHIEKMHGSDRPYICELCGASFGRITDLKVHLSKHEKPYRCERCDYSASNKVSLQTHLFTKHQVKLNEDMTIHKCSKCDYTTDLPSRLRVHMATHNETRSFICPHCGKAFKTNSSLLSHKNWVHKEKKASCDHCPFVTATLSALREHVRVKHTHTTVKPFKCAYCDYLCATSGNCRKHVVCRHPGQPVKVIKVSELYPDGHQPELSVMKAKNPHPSNTIASFEYEIETLMKKEAQAVSMQPQTQPQTQPRPPTPDPSYMYALIDNQSPQQQLALSARPLDSQELMPPSQVDVLPGVFTFNQAISAQQNTEYHTIYSIVAPQSETMQ